MTLAQILEAIQLVIVNVVGGTAGETTITFANSFVGKLLAVFTTTNGFFVLPLLLGFALFGLHILKSLMGR